VPRFHPRLVALATALLLSGALGLAARPAAADSYNFAPWWNGHECDSVHWNKVAASLGWDVTASPARPLGASYLGIQACGPRPSWDKQGTMTAPNVRWKRSGWGENEWQCVELAMRFMAQIYGTQAYSANGWNVVSNYRTAYGGNLTKISNGAVGRSPQPGDIISFGTVSPGHVSVVTANAVDADGNGTITVMSQNDKGSTNGYRTLKVTAWKVAAFGWDATTKWLHRNVVTFSENPLGTVVTSQYQAQGIVFKGYHTTALPYIRADAKTTTAPVLSGSPKFHAGIKGRFVTPGTTTATTVGSVSLDVGHVTSANTIRVTFFDSSGGTIKSVLLSSVGTQRVSATGKIASFAVFEVTAGVGAFSIDNVVMAPSYS
jgi:hypothetical protein